MEIKVLIGLSNENDKQKKKNLSVKYVAPTTRYAFGVASIIVLFLVLLRKILF